MTSAFLFNLAPEKRCFKCGEKKDIGSFYQHGAMSDGYLGKCKDCTCEDVRMNRMVRRGQYVSYEKQRSTHPHRREQARRVNDAWDARHPDRRRASTAVNNAVRDGRLEKSDTCEACGATERLHGHHHDYAQPLSVTWLCPSCHHHVDNVRRNTEQLAAYV